MEKLFCEDKQKKKSEEKREQKTGEKADIFLVKLNGKKNYGKQTNNNNTTSERKRCIIKNKLKTFRNFRTSILIKKNLIVKVEEKEPILSGKK